MILAIETTTEVCSTALIAGDGTVVSVRSLKERNIHSEQLMTLTDAVLTEAGKDRKALTAVAVSIGPGSFTGLRIGLSAAKGLAMALDIPIIAVPTLDAIAEAYRISSSAVSTFCALIDAKREEAFFAFYDVTPDEIIRRTEFAITAKNDILEQAAGLHAVTVQPEISAIPVGLLAYRRRSAFIVADHSQLEPLYLRDFVATLPKKIA